jgi:hypothetical protein
MKIRTNMRHTFITQLSIITIMVIASGCKKCEIDQNVMNESINNAFLNHLNKINQNDSTRSHGGIHLPIDIILDEENDGDIGDSNGIGIDNNINKSKSHANTVINQKKGTDGKYFAKLKISLNSTISGKTIDINKINTEIFQLNINTKTNNGQTKGKATFKHTDDKTIGEISIYPDRASINTGSIAVKDLKPNNIYLLIVSYQEEIKTGTVEFHQGAVTFQVENK